MLRSVTPAACGISAVLFLSTLVASAEQSFAAPLKIQGSTTFNRQIIEPLQAQIEMLSGQKIQIVPNRSALGLLSLAEGRADMAMISAPLANELTGMTQFPEAVLQSLRVHQITSTRVAVGVHASNPVRQTSLTQLTKVLTGEISNWSALGGADAPIRVVVVGEGGGVATTLEAVLLKGGKIGASNLLNVRTAVQLAWVVEQERNAIAFGQLALFEQRGVTQVTTDQPIIQPLSLVTLGEPTPAMTAVIAASRRVAAGM